MSEKVKLPEEMLDIFDDRPTGFISTLRPDGQISVHPVSVVRDGDVLKVSTLKHRKKYRNLLADDRVAICVPQRNDPNRFVEVRGRAEVIDDTDRSFIDRLAQIYMGVDKYTLDPPDYERVVIIIHPEQVWAPDRPFKNPSLAADAS
jgi:PPOX class probable F420-dependent enzyme